MEVESIELKGLTSVPSSLLAKDGQSELLRNLVNEDGALRPVAQPVTVATLPEGCAARYVHRTASDDVWLIGTRAGNLVAWHSADGSLSDIDADNPVVLARPTPSCQFTSVLSIASVGNVLTVCTDGGVLYLLYKDNRYTLLGDRPPVPEIEWSLGISSKSSDRLTLDNVKINLNGAGRDAQRGSDAKEQTDHATFVDAVMGQINKLMGEQRDAFTMPFMVRAAWRLYDGSYAWHTPPVLLVPNAALPQVKIRCGSADHAGAITNPTIVTTMSVAELRWQLLKAVDLGPWHDVIRSLDVFVSSPVYTFETPQEADPDLLGWHIGSECPTLISQEDKQYLAGTVGVNGQRRGATTVYADDDTTDNDTQDTPATSTPTATVANDYTFLQLPVNKSFGKEVRSIAAFYRIASVEVGNVEAMTDEHGVPVDVRPVPLEDTVRNLETRPKLSDDFLSQFGMEAAVSKAYNSRLNLAHVTLTPPVPYSLRQMLPTNVNQVNDNAPVTVWVWSRTNGQCLISKREYTQCPRELFMDRQPWQRWMYVPDPDAFLMHIHFGQPVTMPVHVAEKTLSSTHIAGKPDGGEENFEWVAGGSTIDDDNNQPQGGGGTGGTAKKVQGTTASVTDVWLRLRPHDFLHGAYWWGGMGTVPVIDPPFEFVRDETTDGLNGGPAVITHIYEQQRPEEAEVLANLVTRSVRLPNKVYTSMAENPFIFDPAAVTAVGQGAVMALATSATALSQGQFGQYPLYAFTSQGVWAMQMGATGVFMAVAPVSREVCLSHLAVAELDGSVAFATARGIMHLAGSRCQCLSEALGTGAATGFRPLDTDTLPHLGLLLWRGLEHSTPAHMPSFAAMLPSCRMLYDYRRARLIVFAPGVPAAYVYSFTTAQWGMMDNTLTDTLNAYPDALAVAEGLRLVCLDDVAETVPCLAVTRPLKLKGGYNTLSHLIVRGAFAKIGCTALYGSRDLRSWQLVWSGKGSELRGFSGTPYRYWRLVVAADLGRDDFIAYSDVAFRQRLTGRLR